MKYLLATRGLGIVESVSGNDDLQDALSVIRQSKTYNGKKYRKVGVYLKIAEVDPEADVRKSHLDNFVINQVYQGFSEI